MTAKPLGVICVRGKVEMHDCAACSLRADHPCTLPADFLSVMRKSREPQPGRTEFTPSSLLECDRRTVLSSSHGYYIDVESAWNFLRGNEIHELVEHHGTFPHDVEPSWEYPTGGPVAVIRELRLSAKVGTLYGSVEFTGKPDVIVVKRIENGVAYVKIADYKTTTIDHSLTAARRSNQTQLNCYAWLARQCLPWRMNYVERVDVERVEVEELEIIYTDLKRVRRFTSATHLVDRGADLSTSRLEQVYEDIYTATGRTGKTREVRVMWHNSKPFERLELEPIDLLDQEDIEAWIANRIEQKIEAKTQLPPPLEGESAWVCNYCALREKCYELAGREI